MNTEKFLFATNNQGKMTEAKAIFKQAGLEIISLADLGLEFEPSETGATFEENALQKAHKTAEFLKVNGKPPMGIISDDSGLCIDALGGLPGVDSANYLGRETSYDIRNSRIVNMLADVPRTMRLARFVCVITCLFPDDKVHTARATIEGIITNEPQGENGFGYDPIFFVPDFGVTMAELTAAQKNTISHRGQALRKMIKLIRA